MIDLQQRRVDPAEYIAGEIRRVVAERDAALARVRELEARSAAIATQSRQEAAPVPAEPAPAIAASAPREAAGEADSASESVQKLRTCVGSSFDSFLEERGIRESVDAATARGLADEARDARVTDRDRLHEALVLVRDWLVEHATMLEFRVPGEVRFVLAEIAAIDVVLMRAEERVS